MRAAALALILAGCAPTADETRTSTIRVLDPSLGDACTPLLWPVDAPLSSPFGPRDGRPHTGIDLAAPEGTAVRAACGGVVRFAGDRHGYGRLVIVEHAAGLLTYYAHNSALSVRAGDAIPRGAVVASSGATGRVTAPHVHFEVRRAGVAIDPLLLLAPRSPQAPGSDDRGMGYAFGPAVSVGPRTP